MRPVVTLPTISADKYIDEFDYDSEGDAVNALHKCHGLAMQRKWINAIALDYK